MANKQIVDYIKEAEAGNLKKAEIIGNLKQAGWQDTDIRDAFSYIGLYNSSPFHTGNPKITTYKTAASYVRGGFISLAAVCVGYAWLISGLNKVVGGLFVPNFESYMQALISSGRIWSIYQTFLESLVLPNAQIMATIIQYTELAVGVGLIIFGFWNFFRSSKVAAFILCLASIASIGLIANIILSQALPLPWIDTANVFASGVGVEYLILLLSFVLAIGHFHEL